MTRWRDAADLRQLEGRAVCLQFDLVGTPPRGCDPQKLFLGAKKYSLL